MATRALEYTTRADAPWCDIEGIQEGTPEWLQLCQGASSVGPFCRPEWVAAYMRSFQPDKRVLLLQARLNGRLHAILPLVERTSSVGGMVFRTLQGAANVHSCRFDLVRETGARGDLALEALWSALKELRGWDSIEISRVPENGAAEQLLRLAQRDGFGVGRWPSNQSPYISLNALVAADPSCLLRNAHFRQNFRRRLRKAESMPIVLRRVTEFSQDELDKFFALEQKGWKGTHGTAIACSPAIRNFYTDIAKSAAEAGYLSLYFLELEGTPIAAHFGLTYGGRYMSPKVAYDEAHATLGPGHLIVYFIIRDLARRRCSEFDFLGPMMPWKSEWATGVRPHSNCYIFQKNLRGHLSSFSRFTVLSAARKIVHTPPISGFYERMKSRKA